MVVMLANHVSFQGPYSEIMKIMIGNRQRKKIYRDPKLVRPCWTINLGTRSREIFLAPEF